MLSVDQAIDKILENAAPCGLTEIGPEAVCGRIAGGDIFSKLTQPPFRASAMDGYAVRFEDVCQGGEALSVIGEAPAGSPFAGTVSAGQAVRVFTGAVVPSGADHVIIQEDVQRLQAQIKVTCAQAEPRNIRPAGIDFKKGDVLARQGALLHELHGSLFAAANLAQIPVWRKPRVALFSNGDELREPGAELRPGEIINSNHYSLCKLIEKWGGDADYLGCVPDDEEALQAVFEQAKTADLVVPVGGASVGDYDFVKSAFQAVGGEIIFSKVAVKPGKPTWYGRLAGAHLVGLPGNPASAMVAAALFVQPLLRRLGGAPPLHQQATEKEIREQGAVGHRVFLPAQLTAPLVKNGSRENYLRGFAYFDQACLHARVAPVANQDSSLLLPFAAANVLIRRRPNAPALVTGDEVEVVRLRI